MTPVEIRNTDGTPLRGGRSRRRRAEISARRRRAALVLVLVASVAVVAGVGFQIFHIAFPAKRTEAVDARLAVAESTRMEMADAPGARTPRTIYPYSIVPGGVYGADEATKAAAKDPVVAEHYRDLAVDALHTERVTGPRAVHVSYRIGKEVYWTKRKLTLQPGEMLLSDGKAEVRARCGNRVSDQAQGPVSESEPSAEAFDEPAPIAVPEELPLQGFMGPADRAALSGLYVRGEPSAARSQAAAVSRSSMGRFDASDGGAVFFLARGW